ncbi:MAG TPA: hypothetical protein PKK67_10620, partial [Cyclobacteriaceae bacterium]|nr:hypothetical protein [Cyclobacteriaceae bacterium]
DTLNLYTPRKTSGRLPNNTFFMSYHLYQAKQNAFKAELDNEFNGSLREYVQHLTQQHLFL